MLLQALELLKHKPTINETEQINHSNLPSIQLIYIKRELENIVQDAKKHLEWERKEETKMMKKEKEVNHENELLYYEQQIDVLNGLIKQLDSVIKQVQELEEQKITD